MQPSNNPAIAAMKDIQLSTPIGTWPLAYGYWLSLLLIVILIGLGIFLLVKHYRHGAAKRDAIRQLELLDIDHPQFAVEVNKILKRYALSYLPRSDVAALDGEPWYQWLVSQVKNSDERLPLLLAKRYQPEPLTIEEAQQLKDVSRYWLQRALPLTSPTHAYQKERQC